MLWICWFISLLRIFKTSLFGKWFYRFTHLLLSTFKLAALIVVSSQLRLNRYKNCIVAHFTFFIDLIQCRSHQTTCDKITSVRFRTTRRNWREFQAWFPRNKTTDLSQDLIKEYGRLPPETHGFVKLEIEEEKTKTYEVRVQGVCLIVELGLLAARLRTARMSQILSRDFSSLQPRS
jgi:hypothetical protein